MNKIFKIDEITKEEIQKMLLDVSAKISNLNIFLANMKPIPVEKPQEQVKDLPPENI